MSSYEALTCRAFGYSPMAAPTDRQTLLVLVVLHYACWVSQHFHVCQKSVAAWSTVPLAGTEGHLKSSCCVFFSYDQYLRQRRLQHTWQSTVVPPLWCNVRPWNKVILLLQRRRVLNRCLVGRRRRTVRLGWRSSCREKVAHKVPTSFPKDLSWLFGISWYRLQYWWAIPGNVKNCTVAISRRYVKLYDLAKIQDFHAKVAWFCTRNSTLRFQGISFLRCRLLMFGACFLT